MNTKVLVVEDNQKLNTSIVNMLNKEEYFACGAYSAKEAKELFLSKKPHIILLDIMLHSKNGIELIPFFRQYYNVEIVMISALSDRDVKTLAYENGADDYITKPIDLYELLFKLNAIKRRLIFQLNEIQIGDLTYDIKSNKISCMGKSCYIQPSQMTALKLLHQKYLQKSFLNKNEIIYCESVDETTRIHTLIARLRKNIANIGCKSVNIETIYGKGYQLIVKSYAGSKNEKEY